MKSVLLFIAATSLTVLNARADFTWRGTKDSDFGNAANWETAPTANSTNDGALIIGSGTDKPLAYTVKEGSTTFNGQLMIGCGGPTPGAITITSGTFTVNDTQYGAIIGQTATGSLTVSGGTVNLTGNNPTFIGNEADGTVNLSGGVITVDGDLMIGRNTAMNGANFSGTLNITGGKFTVGGQTSFDVDGGGGAGGTGAKKINMGAGNGLFEQTKQGTLTFPSNSIAYVNFVTGSKGSISLFGATNDYFAGLVKDGHIKIDDKPAQASSFRFKASDKQGSYSLAH